MDRGKLKSKLVNFLRHLRYIFALNEASVKIYVFLSDSCLLYSEFSDTNTINSLEQMKRTYKQMILVP